jgi:hypothetical protein
VPYSFFIGLSLITQDDAMILLFCASAMVGATTFAALSWMGAPDLITVPFALLATIWTFVLCFQTYKHGSRLRRTRIRWPRITAYSARTPVPEQIEEQLADGARHAHYHATQRKRWKRRNRRA